MLGAERDVSGGATVENHRANMVELRFVGPLSSNSRFNTASLRETVGQELALVLVHVRAESVVWLRVNEHDFRCHWFCGPRGAKPRSKHGTDRYQYRTLFHKHR